MWSKVEMKAYPTGKKMLESGCVRRHMFYHYIIDTLKEMKFKSLAKYLINNLQN